MSTVGSLGQAIEQRLPGVHHHLRFLRWRMACVRRIIPGWLDRRLDSYSHRLVHELRREGIAIRTSAELFGNDLELYAEARQYAERLWREARAAAEGADEQALQHLYAKPGKEFKIHLLPREVSADDPFIRLALRPNLVGLANSYMRMRTYLRAVHLYWDVPSAESPKSSQLWHRDLDDVMNMKVFIYFNDISVDNGPFCFIPRTHLLGRRRFVTPPSERKRRFTDEEMANIVSSTDWRVCTGLRDTVIVCDTYGYHKGLKPEQGDRLSLMFQYTSGCVPAKAMRTFVCVGKPRDSLTAPQRWALELSPWKHAGRDGGRPEFNHQMAGRTEGAETRESYADA